MNAEVVTGNDAENHFNELVQTAEVVELACTYTGKQRLKVTWGRTDETAFVYTDDSEGRTHLSISDQGEAGQLYQQVVTWLIRRQSFVDPSPHSPEYFQPERNIDGVIEEINSVFGTAVKFEL